MRVSTVILTSLAALSCGASVHAQCSLAPTDAAGPVAPRTQEAIKACAVAATAAFKGDFVAIRTMRVQLLAPLRAAAVSADFRLTFDASIGPVVASLANDPRDEAAINALRIAGEIGGNQSMAALKAGLDDKRPAVRMMAAAGYQRTLQLVAANQSALLQPAVVRSVAELRARAAVEAEAPVLDAVVGALEAACTVPANGDFTTVALDAAAALSSVIGDRAADRAGALAPAAMLPAMVRAAGAVQSVLTNVGPAAPRLDQAVRKASGRFAADLLAHAKCRVDAGNLQPEDRLGLSQLAARAENILILASTQLGTRRNSLGLGDSLSAGDKDKAFQAGVGEIVGADGAITKAPFNEKPDRFACER